MLWAVLAQCPWVIISWCIPLSLTWIFRGELNRNVTYAELYWNSYVKQSVVTSIKSVWKLYQYISACSKTYFLKSLIGICDKNATNAENGGICRRRKLVFLSRFCIFFKDMEYITEIPAAESWKPGIIALSNKSSFQHLRPEFRAGDFLDY